ncbi:recombinase family protein [Primorskyibacter marinus]|uniref:recombinase family protein n=1 Tax=Primorskyibacter marinus TaxID=1977320 RepID=UPI000E3020A1|nr:recombinase family protein [Primorskyibacter marinus]
MTKPIVRKLRCAVYTRKSSEEGLEQEFNSLHAQRDACEAYIASQRSEGWVLVRDQYDDGGISGGTLDRPGLQQLMADIEDGLVDVVVVYKIDRLSRSLAYFAKLVEVFDRNDVTFVSVTQSFNTTTSMGRLTLNILLSFAQFEREVTAERIRDKVAASRKKGTWKAARADTDDIAEADARVALQQLDPVWDELFPAEQARIVALLIERIDIGTEGLNVRFRIDGLGGLAREMQAGGIEAAA